MTKAKPWPPALFDMVKVKVVVKPPPRRRCRGFQEQYPGPVVEVLSARRIEELVVPAF